MLKRHAIQVLHRAGRHTLDEIAALTAVAKRSVQRVSVEPMITQTVEGAAADARPMGRPAKAEAYRAQVIGWLTEDPSLLSVELLRRATLAGYGGAKSAL